MQSNGRATVQRCLALRSAGLRRFIDHLTKLAMREHISNLEIFGGIVGLVRWVARWSLRFLLNLLS